MPREPPAPPSLTTRCGRAEQREERGAGLRVAAGGCWGGATVLVTVSAPGQARTPEADSNPPTGGRPWSGHRGGAKRSQHSAVFPAELRRSQQTSHGAGTGLSGGGLHPTRVCLERTAPVPGEWQRRAVGDEDNDDGRLSPGRTEPQLLPLLSRPRPPLPTGLPSRLPLQHLSSASSLLTNTPSPPASDRRCSRKTTTTRGDSNGFLTTRAPLMEWLPSPGCQLQPRQETRRETGP